MADSAHTKLWRELTRRLGAEEADELHALFSGWQRIDQRRVRRVAMKSQIKKLTKVVADLRARNDDYYDSTIARHEKTIARTQARLDSPMYQEEGGAHDSPDSNQ